MNAVIAFTALVVADVLLAVAWIDIRIERYQREKRRRNFRARVTA